MPEEARAVVGKWCSSVPARLARVAAPPAFRTAAPLRALSRVLPRLRRINVTGKMCHGDGMASATVSMR